MLHQTAVEDDSVGLEFCFEMGKTFLKPLGPRLEAPSPPASSAPREVFFQAPASGWMWPSTVFQVRHQRSVLVKGGTESCPHGQRQHPLVFLVTCAVLTLSHGHSVGIVDQRELSAVETLQSCTDVNTDPSLAKVRRSERSAINHSAGKPHPDGSLPSDDLQRILNGRKNGVRVGRIDVSESLQFTNKRT